MAESEAPITWPRSRDCPSTKIRSVEEIEKASNSSHSLLSLAQGHKNVIHRNGSAFLHWVAIAVVNGLVRIPVEEADMLSGRHCPRDIKTQFSFSSNSSSSTFFNVNQINHRAQGRKD
ncbi:hypothetical protein PRUPE_1G102200 [Prunus persica]|uniref:Uncharacterized protein n=1 Tax=Prunus persica TaxID=3760 RepID=A0A251QW93_PRUPE|nr:hypothetical protein PRUPE_1G102200 [Prunus persica]